MDWRERIETTPDTLFGKPRIKGTRIGVAFVLDLLAAGWGEARILQSYPHLKREDLQAVFAFVRDRQRGNQHNLDAGHVPDGSV